MSERTRQEPPPCRGQDEQIICSTGDISGEPYRVIHGQDEQTICSTLSDAMLFRRIKINRKRSISLTLFAVGFLLTISVSFLSVYKTVFFSFLDYKIYDTLLRSSPFGETSSVPVIIDIDEKSLTQFGQWPWPRYRVARLLDKVRTRGAAGIGLDMIFAEPDRTSLGIVKEEMKRDLGVNISCGHVSDPFFDNDRILAEALAGGPFVLGYEFTFEGKSPETGEDVVHPVPVAFQNGPGTSSDSPLLIKATGVIGNLKEFSTVASASGFFNFAPDTDSIIRRVPLLIAYKEKIYPSLSLAVLLQALHPKRLFLKTLSNGEQFFYMDDKKVPLDGNGRLLIHYRGPRNTFPYVSAADVLNDLTARDAFQDKIVFIGSSAIGLKELRPTPLDPLFPGVEIHATVVDNILREDFLVRPFWVPGLELLLTLSLGIGSAVLLIRFRARWSFLFVVICGTGMWGASVVAFRARGIFISPLFPLIVLGANFSVLNLLKYWREEQKVRARDREIAIAQEFTMQCLASLVETRHSETGGHILRTQQYVRTLCLFLADHPKFKKHLTSEAIEMICKAAPLHDIGKVGIPDRILLNRGKLTPEDFDQMKNHTVYGYNVIANAQKRLGRYESGRLFLNYAKEMAYTHHEKWDGSGYPRGLKGEEIPLSGRIMALADVYDALISSRFYKKAFTHEKAHQIIVEGKGKHFDPDLVDAFLKIEPIFIRIASEFADRDDEKLL